MARKRKVDKALLLALTKAYTARALLFHNGIASSNIDLLIAEIDAINEQALKWDLEELGISANAAERLKKTGGRLHQVFAHPMIVSQRPHLIAYYRNVATISQKGIAQILFPTARFEKRGGSTPGSKNVQKLCVTLNRIISGVIDALPNYEVAVSRKAIMAEIGAQLQGTWANVVGQGASKAVETIIRRYLEDKKLGERNAPGKYSLKNGWSIIFGTEPDVAFLDSEGTKQIAIEIKGSLDVAGAQTRYGEAKKSFAKQIADNARCYTIYLASCFTDAVIQQIKADGQVRDWYNLTSILYDEQECVRFLNRLFHQVKTPRR